MCQEIIVCIFYFSLLESPMCSSTIFSYKTNWIFYDPLTKLTPRISQHKNLSTVWIILFEKVSSLIRTWSLQITFVWTAVCDKSFHTSHHIIFISFFWNQDSIFHLKKNGEVRFHRKMILTLKPSPLPFKNPWVFYEYDFLVFG